MYRLELSKKAVNDLKKMDRPVALMLSKKMKDKIDGIENPRSFGKALSGNKKGLWRYRIGNYRIICHIEDFKLIVLALELGHRKNIYERA